MNVAAQNPGAALRANGDQAVKRAYPVKTDTHYI